MVGLTSTQSEIAVAAAVALASFGGIWKIQNKRFFRGYEGIAKDIRRIAQTLRKTRVARQNDEIVITGRRESIPFTIRFSQADMAPGIYIRCEAPVDFALSFCGKDENGSASHRSFRIGNHIFDSRFVGATDSVFKSKRFVGQPGCQENLQRLCNSKNTVLEISAGKVEFGEAIIPDDAASRVISCLRSLAIIVRHLEAASPSRKASAKTPSAFRKPLALKSALAAVCAMIVVIPILLRDNKSASKASSSSALVLSDIAADDRVLISNGSGWKLAEVENLSPEFVRWVRNSGASPATRFTMDPNGQGKGEGTVYLLESTSNGKTKRIVWILERRVVFDYVGAVDGVVPISKEKMPDVRWSESGAPTVQIDGDGLLVIRDHTRPDSTTVYFMSQRALHTAVPADFNSISIS